MDKVLDMLLKNVASRLLKNVASRLLEDVDEDSTALAFAIETFA